jgi:hypothetical protein
MKTVSKINDLLNDFGLYIEKDDRSPKGMKRFFIRGGSQSYRGSDGEMNYCALIAVQLVVKSVKDLSLASIEALFIEKHKKDFAAVKVFLDEKEAEEAARIAALNEAREVERVAKSQAFAEAAEPVNSDVINARIDAALHALNASDAEKLQWFNEQVEAIVSDDYRADFLSLVNAMKDTRVFVGVFFGLFRANNPRYVVNASDCSQINAILRKYGLSSHSIGGGKVAINYVVSKCC